MTDKVQLIKEEIEKLKTQNETYLDKEYAESTKWHKHGAYDACNAILSFIDSLPEEPKCIYNRTLDERKKFCRYCSAACDVRIEEEPVNEDLEEEIDKCWEGWIDPNPEVKGVNGYLSKDEFSTYARHFAEWQKQKDKQLGWHDAKKEQPPMDEEVIVLTNTLNGKELNTPRMICFGHIVNKEYCIDYDGWNIPGVAYWMYYKEPK